MKTLIWKLRFTLTLCPLLHIPWRMCWDAAGAWIEMNNNDLAICPVDCARAEYDEWTELAAWNEPGDGKL